MAVKMVFLCFLFSTSLIVVCWWLHFDYSIWVSSLHVFVFTFVKIHQASKSKVSSTYMENYTLACHQCGTGKSPTLMKTYESWICVQAQSQMWSRRFFSVLGNTRLLNWQRNDESFENLSTECAVYRVPFFEQHFSPLTTIKSVFPVCRFSTTRDSEILQNDFKN